VYLKIFGQNQIQKFKVLCSRQLMEVENNVKITKKSFVFLENLLVSQWGGFWSRYFNVNEILFEN
jgi:hypothetical protein